MNNWKIGDEFLVDTYIADPFKFNNNKVIKVLYTVLDVTDYSILGIPVLDSRQSDSILKVLRNLVMTGEYKPTEFSSNSEGLIRIRK